jgi:thiamine biosynthesis lipoprotein
MHYPFSIGWARVTLATGVLLICASLLGGCRQAGEHTAELYVFGTIVEIRMWGVDAALAANATGELQREFRAMHRDWHAWEPGLLMDINTAFAQGRAIEASEDLVAMIRTSQRIEQRSGGRFNPAIGGLVHLWGFHTSEYPIDGPPPGRSEIENEVAASPSTADIDIEGMTLSARNPAVRLDFGGIAKGMAVDVAIARLRSLGIDNAIVNAGGDLRAIGRHGDRPWRVAVRKPGGGVIAAVEVDGDEALFTSGNYERFRQSETRRYPHILDPRDGWPAEGLASVTVIAADGVLADAAATALIVAGPEEWRQVAADLGLDQVLVVDEAGDVSMTAAMRRRVTLVGDG